MLYCCMMERFAIGANVIREISKAMNSLYTYVPTYASTNTVMIKDRAMCKYCERNKVWNPRYELDAMEYDPTCPDCRNVVEQAYTKALHNSRQEAKRKNKRPIFKGRKAK